MLVNVVGLAGLAGTVACGAQVRATADRGGTLTLNHSHLLHNPSGQFQTFPGIYDNIDGHDGPPVMIDSTDS